MTEEFTVEQKLAINKRNSNVLVSASAGSGKTRVLISRVIDRVIDDEIDIDKLLVVTFTNAAALELKERLKKSFDKALEKNKDKKQFIKKQIKLLNRANISTLHAFCLKVIRENFEKLDIDPNFKVAEESEIYNLKLKALNNVFENEYKKDDKILTKLLRLFNYKEEDLFLEILNVYSYIMCYGEPFKFLEESIAKYNVLEICDLYNLDFGYKIYQDVLSRLKLLKAKIEEKIACLERYEDFEKIIERLNEDLEAINLTLRNSEKSWDKLYENLRNIDFKNLPAYKGNNIELKEEISNFRKTIIKAEIEKCKKNISDNSENIIENNKNAYEYLKYLLYILQKFDSEFNRLKLEKNIVDFSDIEHMMYKLLYENGKITEFGKEIKNNFKEVYTDEYQDISEIQEDILEAISNGNNRFMVGDTKQSIYRFRGASPDIFNEKIDKYTFSENINSKEDTKILLAKNFRSRKEVVDAVNLIFENLMSKEAGGCDYGEQESLKCGASYKNESKDYIAELNVINLKKDEIITEEEKENSSDEDDLISELKDFEIEAYYVADKIKKIVGNLDSEEKENIRKVKYSDIVILLRNVTGKAKILEDVLKKKGIPVFCDVSSSIFDFEEVDLLLSFLRLIDNKYQDVYLVASMYSVIGGFNLNEIVKIKNNKKATYFYDLLIDYAQNGKDTELVKKVKKFLDRLNYYEEISKKKSVSELILDIYNNTGLYFQFIIDKEGKSRCANLDLILDMCLEFEKNNLANLSEYISYVDSLKNKIDSSSMSAKTIGENEDVVRIMTIHKSKGLEFPVVILCDTNRRYNFKDTNYKDLLDKNIGIGINIVNEDYNISYPSIIKQAIKYSIINGLKDEELRILYVALTRAKEKLIIFGTTKDYEKLNSSLFVMKNKDKIDPYVVHQSDSYLKNILTVLKASEKYSDKLEFNLIKENVADIIENNEDTFATLSDEINSIRNEYNKAEILQKIKELEERVNKYKIINEGENIARVSVSELKKQEGDILFTLPSCISKKKVITGARKGTLIHFILQILDFKNINSKADLEKFINDSKVIDSDDKKAINIDSINNFLNSNIGKAIKKAKLVKREEEFILKNSSFSKNVIQGVIDLYYIDENDNLILVDFKTDNLETKKDFIDRYEKQLLIYKEALEKLLKKQVYKTYIYSFKLNKEIDLGE